MIDAWVTAGMQRGARFINPHGFGLDFDHNEKLWFGRSQPIWKFYLKDPPLQWINDQGETTEVCRKAYIGCPTDGGSIPWLVTIWIQRLAFVRSFCGHNVTYRSGYVWVVNADGSTYRKFLSRAEVDEVLYQQCLAEGASEMKAKAIWMGVRAGGWYAWMKHRRLDGRKEII